MNRTKLLRIFSFIIGLAMLLTSIIIFLDLSLFHETNEIGITCTSLVGFYFLFYAVTGTVDAFKYFKINKFKWLQITKN